MMLIFDDNVFFFMERIEKSLLLCFLLCIYYEFDKI